MNLDSLPIAAIATAPGRGGIGVVRLSGKKLRPLLDNLFGSAIAATLQPRHATYLPFTNADGDVIDQGLALFFPAPHSYTGEDVLELHGHGGPVVLQMLLARCLEVGQVLELRLAQPGEFTRRAFMNDKLDLAQAEAVADLIDASTETAARSASRSLSGVFSNTVNELVEKVTQLRMLVEATLDFPEEEIDFLEKSDARGQLAVIRSGLETIFTQASQGALLRDGLNVVLAGQPNVGKSSLLNALAGSEVAIVTPIAGTTRDKVIETIQIDGLPLCIIDTAGIRDIDSDSEHSSDQVERIGIERTWQEVEQADVILHLMDASRGPTRAD
ncbi:MAG: tRNA uridine-5-carboxymethylaminomethyl(34) synthesis GTPase MnmE, partial [Herbaspirillum sp.]